MNTTLQCLECGEIFVTADTVSVGGLPRCADCNGAITIPGVLDIACCNCDFRQRVTGINVNECSACPKCGWALDVVAQDLDASSAENVDDTIQKESDYLEKRETIAILAADVDENIAPEERPYVTREGSDNQNREATIALISETSGKKSEGGSPASDPTVLTETPLKTKKQKEDAEESAGITEKKFGKYEIVEELARGGMGIVYKVIDADLKRTLALKVLIAGEGASEELLKRFMREARAAAQINHPNVVPIHEVGNIKGQYYFTMELIEGPSFDKIIASKWMPVDEMVTHIRDIATALKAAHEMGIIHRDIKPANIMFDVKNNRAMLTDFGLAKDMDSNTMLSMTGMMMGSPAYMSPEQARGMIHNIDSRSDIYSLGVVLYEALTGVQPFTGDTIVETVRKAVYDDPVPPRRLAPEIHSDLQNIILHAMEKKPENRYQEMYELINDLNSYLAGRKVLAKAPSAAAVLWRKLRRRPLMLAFVTGAPFAAALIIMTVWYMFFSPQPLDLAAESLMSKDPHRQAGAVSNINSWIKDGIISSAADRKRALKLLEKALSSEHQDVVVQACLALEKLGDPEGILSLTALLQNPDIPDKVKQSAITALSTLAAGADKHEKESMNSALMKLASDKSLSRDLRIVAIRASVDSWGKNTMKTMLDIAEDKSEDEDLRVAAIRSVETKLTMGSPSMYNIIRLSSDRNKKVKNAAIEALHNSRSHTSILDLYGLKDQAAAVSTALGGVLEASARNQQKIMDMINENETHVEKKKTLFDVITEKLTSSSAETRMAAAYDLGTLNDGRGVPYLEKLLSDDDADVVCVAAESIVKLMPKQKPDMKKIAGLLDSPVPVVREQAVYIIGEADDHDALQAVIKKADNETSMPVVIMMADIMRNVSAGEALPVLNKLLKNSMDRNSAASVECIRSLQTFGRESAEYLIPLLNSHNSNIKDAALKALTEMSGRDYGTDIAKWKQWTQSK